MNTLPDNPPDATQSARERILLTAHDLFYREGIRATGVDRIIAEASVSKVTFYRHFPSKNDLVAAYLDYRHAHWLAWFTASLARVPRNARFPLAPVVTALRDWFDSPMYRGCAFINGVVELGEPVAAVSLRHKADMEQAIAALLPPGKGKLGIAQAAALAVDGAIIRAQMEQQSGAALAGLDRLLRALCATLRPSVKS